MLFLNPCFSGVLKAQYNPVNNAMGLTPDLKNLQMLLGPVYTGHKSINLIQREQVDSIRMALLTLIATKQPTGNYITALTGDATASGPGNAVITFTTVNSNTGGFGSASSVPVFSVTAKGFLTGVTNTPILITESQVTSLVSDLADINSSISGLSSSTSANFASVNSSIATTNSNLTSFTNTTNTSIGSINSNLTSINSTLPQKLNITDLGLTTITTVYPANNTVTDGAGGAGVGYAVQYGGNGMAQLHSGSGTGATVLFDAGANINLGSNNNINLILGGTPYFSAIHGTGVMAYVPFVSNISVETQHLLGHGSPPSFVVGSAAGSGATVSTLNSTDSYGTIIINTGTSTGTGVVVTGTFNMGYAVNPKIIIGPGEGSLVTAQLGGNGLYPIPATTTFTLNTIGSALAPSTTYKYSYHIGQ